MDRARRFYFHNFGFAAGCEAVAVPHRERPDYFRAMPLVLALPLGLLGQRPHEGQSPIVKGARMAGQSHRLTSDGKPNLQ